MTAQYVLEPRKDIRSQRRTESEAPTTAYAKELLVQAGMQPLAGANGVDLVGFANLNASQMRAHLGML
jgi:hypothetical protein